MLMRRIVFHCEVPDFAVTIERVRDRSLSTRAVIIAPPGNPRGLVQAVSQEAREAGVVRGMRLGAAQRLCPNAVILQPDRLLYHRATRAMERLLGQYTPVIERTNAGRFFNDGRFFLDMTGTGRLLGSPRDAAQRILREASTGLRLTAGIGIAINKSVSQVASSLVRADLLDVLPGSEEPFLSPWHIQKLPGTERVSEPRLFEDLNLQRIGQLADCSVNNLAMAFGKIGRVLHQRAHGIDPRPVTPPRKKPRVQEEEILEEETNERGRLLASIRFLSERCGFKMRQLGVFTRTIFLQVGYTDNLLLDGSAQISATNNDDATLYDAARKLFYRIAYRRVRVRYLALTFSDLFPTATQLELFTAGGRGHREDPLTRAMDGIRARFGSDFIRRGSV
jgi:DNA polymerase-4